MYNVAVFVSGRGSNLKFIIDSLVIEQKIVEVKGVFSNKIDCAAFEIAEENNISTYAVSLKKKEDYISFSELPLVLDKLKIDLIVLAGFLKKIPDELIDLYKDKIINIHPALLPSFGGKGMYGMNVHQAVFDKSCQVSGATIHFVDKIYDNGKIIAQRSVDISDVDSPEQIAERVLKIEHKLLPFTIQKFAEGKVTIKNNRVFLMN
ncbi:MAG: phosphoribosylglycinamide formyltransferase [Melioribacteraceae bacterium]|nr:phosphoribosylglycinamide formyltransferase [Melioribacteraceae bacterium]